MPQRTDLILYFLSLHRFFESGALAKKECFGLMLLVNLKRTGPYISFLVSLTTAQKSDVASLLPKTDNTGRIIVVTSTITEDTVENPSRSIIGTVASAHEPWTT